MDIKTHPHFITVNAHYPRIAAQIELFWGHEGFDVVINKMMNDTRDGQRAGFPPPVSEALIKLLAEHSQTFPHLTKSESDLWSLAHQR